jgi:thiol-disulfide isomerase/thioredoxin
MLSKYFFFIVLLFGINRVYGQDILLGSLEARELEKPPFDNWYKSNYENYSPDESQLDVLSNSLEGKKITIFFGTWCGDSKREVPKLTHLLDRIDFPTEDLELIAVNNAPGLRKTTPEGLESGRYIFRVPTIIVEENGTELGRIIESPKESLEADLIEITKGTYTPVYGLYPGVATLDKAGAFTQKRPKFKKYLGDFDVESGDSGDLSTVIQLYNQSGEELKALNVARLNQTLYPTDSYALSLLLDELKKAGKVKEALKVSKAYQKATGDNKPLTQVENWKK